MIHDKTKEQHYREQYVTILTFDSTMLKEFDEVDARKRPKRKKKVLDWCGTKRLGMLPLINKFLNVASRQQQNQMKQQFHDYTKFILNKHNIDKSKLQRCGVIVKHYLPTRSKFDLDGVFVKASFDSLSDWGFWEDDNYTIVEPLFFTGGYDKENPRSEIQIYEINEEYDRNFVLEIMKQELESK